MVCLIQNALLSGINYKLSMKNQRGLTLIELMVTLAVFAIVAALAFPGFQLYRQNSHRTTQINDLVAGLNLARTEAIKRRLSVTLCTSINGATCSNVNNWTIGWIVFVDDNQNGLNDPTDNNGLIDPAAGEINILNTHARLSGANLVYTDIDNGAVSIMFNARGIPTVFDAGGAQTNSATFMRCDNRRTTEAIPNQHARAVLLTTAGRVRLSGNIDNDLNNIHEDLAGASLNCPP